MPDTRATAQSGESCQERNGLARRVAVLREPKPLEAPQDQAESPDDRKRCTPSAKIGQQRDSRNSEDRAQEARTDEDTEWAPTLGWGKVIGNDRHAIGWNHRRADAREKTAHQ